MKTPTTEWPALRDPAADQIVLRDGSVVMIRPTAASDRDALQGFFHRLTPDSRHKRFFITAEPTSEVVARFCDSSLPGHGFTLIALREQTGSVQVVAVASYCATRNHVAEAAFAVADGLHGKGLGTALLERLARIASDHGFESFEATTLTDNAEMLDVFRQSGFEVTTKTLQGVIEVRLSLTPTSMANTAMNERNRVATVASLHAVFRPHQIAVIGASRDESSLGRRVFEAVIRSGFDGPVYAINPSATELGEHRCYPSVRDVPLGVDLAVVVTPRHAILRVLDDCAAAGVLSVVIISAGFAEADDEGRSLQRAALEKARAHGMRLVGPNCMGVLNAGGARRFNASLAEVLPPKGRLAIASQSGGIGLALLEFAAARQLGISTFISLGNKADVSGNDILQWDESDPDTSVILLYLESLGNPHRFAQLARRIGAKKPIVVLKAGRTMAGIRAAGSHTAGLASTEANVAALFKQCGIIRTDTIDEMFDVAECLDLQPLPAGNRVGIITNTGGPGILAADACEAAGLTVQPFGTSTRQLLSQELSANATASNPVDLVASAGATDYEHAIVTALGSSEIDSLLVVYTPINHSATDNVLTAIGKAVERSRITGAAAKTVAVCHLSVARSPVPLTAGDERLPVYTFPEAAARALGHAAAYARWRRTATDTFPTFDDLRIGEARALCESVVTARGDTWLTTEELRRLLNAFGLTMVVSGTARDEAEAVATAAIVGYPVVLKVDSPKLLHKSDVGAVRLHLQDDHAVRGAFRDLSERFPDTLVAGAETILRIQPMVTGPEVLVGVVQDPTFGPTVAFGLGGVDAEALRDVAFRVVPLQDEDVSELVQEVKTFRLLQAYRGRPVADIVSLRELLLRVSLLAQHLPELRELDLNPVIVGPATKGCHIVDARVRVAPRSTA